VVLPRNAGLRAEARPELLGGVTVIAGDAKDGSGKPVGITAVPYYAWANRGKGAMTVWVREAGDR
jgi:DUF1680 family protein